MNPNDDKPNPPKLVWNDDEDRLLLIMSRHGQRRETIAARLGCTEEEVAQRLRLVLARLEQEQAKPKTPVTGLSESMLARVQGLDALEAVFTIHCAKFDELGQTLRIVSEALTTAVPPDKDNLERWLACVFAEPEFQALETEDERLAALSMMIHRNFILIPRRKIEFRQVPPAPPAANNG